MATIDVLQKPIQIMNNLTTTVEGYALDASQGNWLYENKIKINLAVNQTVKFMQIINTPMVIMDGAINTPQGIVGIKGNMLVNNTTNDEEFVRPSNNITQFYWWFPGKAEGISSCTILPQTDPNLSQSTSYFILSSNPYSNAYYRTSSTFMNTGISFYTYKIGPWCWMTGGGETSTSVASGHTFGTLPAGYRPKANTLFQAPSNIVNVGYRLYITTGGVISIRHTLAKSVKFFFSTMYLTS